MSSNSRSIAGNPNAATKNEGLSPIALSPIAQFATIILSHVVEVGLNKSIPVWTIAKIVGKKIDKGSYVCRKITP